jgi:hypothetical protein
MQVLVLVAVSNFTDVALAVTQDRVTACPGGAGFGKAIKEFMTGSDAASVTNGIKLKNSAKLSAKDTKSLSKAFFSNFIYYFIFVSKV